MARATWNGVVLAETGRPVVLEGNVHFPPEDVRREHQNAAWYYPHPSPLARKIRNHVAFWNGVQADAASEG